MSSKYNTRFFFEWFDSSINKNKSIVSFQILPSVKITSKYSFSPTLLIHLIKGKYNFFVAGAVGQLNTYITFLVSKLLRKPFIFYDENWFWPRTKWRHLIWPFLSRILKSSDAIIVPGSRSKEFYVSINTSIENKIFIAPNVSMLPQNSVVRHRADALRKELSLENKQVILYCGRLVRVKGFEYLLKAFSNLQESNPKTILIVVGGIYGTGNKYGIEELEKIYRVFGREKVHFAGTKVNPEKAAYFLIADVTVVPSIFLGDEYEVWGFAVNESMSVSKPVVATRAVGSAYDLIQNGKNGYIVPDKDPDALSNAIRLVLADARKCRTMGQESFKIIQESFKYENMLMGFEQAIKFVSNNA